MFLKNDNGLSRTLVNAIETNDLNTVRSLIDCKSVDMNAPLPVIGEPPALVLAALRGRAAIVAMLLNAGAHVDSTDMHGWTACHSAASNGHADVVAVLLTHMPNLALTNFLRQTPVELASWKNDGNIIAALIDAGAPLVNRDCLCEAASTSTAVIQALLDRNVVINELRDRRGRTPLHHAARGTFNSAVLSALVNLCDVDARDPRGNTCSSIAASNGQGEHLRLFIEAGADIELANLSDRTPLHGACTDGEFGCVSLLVAAGANVHAKCTWSRTALHYVSLGTPGATAAVHTLLAVGADPDALDRNGISPHQRMFTQGILIDADQIEIERRHIVKMRLDWVRHRALQVCVGL